ncbi:hypothetical protein LC593_10725 [Nostoc sp. CHAB 5844]|nr:hypothetical protein [Nostoc sp. CHAB 5844]
MGRLQRVSESRREDNSALSEKLRAEVPPPLQTSVTQHSALISITLSDGTVARFNTVTLEDVRSLASSGSSNPIEVAGRLIVRVCIAWGDKPGIALPQLRNVDIEDVELISETLSPPAIPEFSELSDRSLFLTLSTGVEVIFRRPNYGDVEAISKRKDGDLESQVALAVRLCTKWGDRDSVDESTLNKLNMGDWQGVALLLQSFRSKRQSD